MDNISRQLKWQRAKKAAGLCAQCGKPVHPGSIARCLAHILDARERNRARQGCSPKVKGGPGRTPLPS